MSYSYMFISSDDFVLFFIDISICYCYWIFTLVEELELNFDIKGIP